VGLSQNTTLDQALRTSFSTGGQFQKHVLSFITPWFSWEPYAISDLSSKF